MPVEPLPNPGPLTVIINGRPVGTVLVHEHYPVKIFGAFIPSAAFEPYRPVFAAAVELARQLDDAPDSEAIDYIAWERLMAAYGDILALGVGFAELPRTIKEFAVGADWCVEVTFNSASE